MHYNSNFKLNGFIYVVNLYTIGKGKVVVGCLVEDVEDVELFMVQYIVISPFILVCVLF